MVGPRTRSITRGVSTPGGYKGYYNPTNALWYDVHGYSGTTDYATMSDTTMAPPFTSPHSLAAERRTVEVGRINGINFVGAIRYEFSDYNQANVTDIAYCPSPSSGDSNTELVTKALARMNPSRPKVDLPVFIFELKDFPRMLRQLGNILSGAIKASDVAGGYIAYSFGWAPLISDVSKLIGLTKLIDDRMRYLSRLEAGGRVKRSLGSRDFATADLGTGGNSLAGITWKWKRTEKHKSWATANVKLLGALPTKFEDRRWLAARAALGLNASAASIWEAIPWTWLIDYLSNVGDILDAGRGFIPHRVSSMCIMTTKTVQLKAEDVVSTGTSTTFTGGVLKTVSKSRAVIANPTPGISFNSVLTGHQAAILASLTTSSALRKIGK